MKTLGIMICLAAATLAQAQHKLPHGMVYGAKPNTTQIIAANKLEDWMARRPRVSTTIKGRVLKVTDVRGGWFEMDGGRGRVIAAHFNRSGVNLPKNLAGKTAVVEGIAQRQMVAADKQHFAGDRANGHQPEVNTDPRKHITFEAKGLEVY
ncbi:uncharacterized protein DUF4920 [Mucilaginibacter yixingensis]|uniref:Uncharacterized protein DUF4920 n=2 Tax=Mucilaginibacter yixingensis TaxID=1295612 RepID=A0A2T5JDS7_9SPHI|nr:DUF4920 domain-containing protein [Mucilaginibacter yixingensis]PTQ99914.1 uncharacterized protein DUF4920 [Mucilaginibacter yixingensis]